MCNQCGNRCGAATVDQELPRGVRDSSGIEMWLNDQVGYLRWSYRSWSGQQQEVLPVHEPECWRPGGSDDARQTTCRSTEARKAETSPTLPPPPLTIAGGGGPGGDGRDGCLIHASFGTSELQNADSARLCRFRKSQQKHKLTGPNLLAQNLSVSDLKSNSLAG